ncbi:MAG: polyprenyl synthetase family protein [Solirubrobacterales bacterium]
MRGRDAEPATSSFEAAVVAGGERVVALMQRTERELTSAAGGYSVELSTHALGTLTAGGKRLRPLLVFLCGVPAASDALVRMGAAVELVHMATLVHDDVVDAAPLRRGQPTVFASAGPVVATATGDFLLSRALRLLAANGDSAQLRVLSDACLALSQGEFAQRADVFAAGIEESRYLLRCDLKTARLFSAACTLGGLAAERPRDQVELLSSFGVTVGLAFQMLDDVLDVSGPAELTGKRRGTDLLEGTTTLPLILAREIDPLLRGLELREIRDPARAELVCDRIAATGALERARARATEMIAEAKASLEGGLDSELRSALDLVADGIVERYA